MAHGHLLLHCEIFRGMICRSISSSCTLTSYWMFNEWICERRESDLSLSLTFHSFVLQKGKPQFRDIQGLVLENLTEAENI